LDLCRRVRPGRRLTAASQGADLERRVGHQHQRRRAEQRARFEMINSRPQGTLRRGARSERPTHCSRAHRRNLRVVHRSCGFKAACSTWKPARPEERADHTRPSVLRSRRDSCEKPTQGSPGHREIGLAQDTPHRRLSLALLAGFNLRHGRSPGRHHSCSAPRSRSRMTARPRVV